MKRILLFALFTSSAFACNLSQDLGSDERDGGATTPTPSATTSASASTDGGANPAPTGTGTSDASVPPVTVADSGSDATVLAPCPTVVGYPAAPYMRMRFTGGGFLASEAGVRDTSTLRPGPFTIMMAAGHFVSAPPGQTDYNGHYLVNVTQPFQQVGGNFVGPSWSMALMTEETGAVLTTGASYPITIRYSGGEMQTIAGDAPSANPQTVADDRRWRYPGSGLGSCTLTVDFAQSGAGVRACLDARFTCTGLVGKGSGESFDIVEGRLAYASK